jgi:hypothetical protein
MMKPFRAAAVLLGLLLVAGCGTSSSQLVGPARPPINPADVRVYKAPPSKFEQIAFLDATSGTSFFHGTAQGEANAIEKLKIEAAKVGANGVLLTLVDDRPTGAIGIGVGGGGISGGRGGVTAASGSASGGFPLVSNGARGIAIYVPNQR